MLTKEENELICRVGPGTPMGELMRQYWIPALVPEELPEPDGPPMRLRLLGEDLVAFRVTSGKVGIFVDSCAHRGTSMFYGRNEEDGLRCVYHGWKYDVTGQCVDMPSEPATSNFKQKVKIGSYPCLERNGIIWTYMGPRETPPPLPDLAPNLEPGCKVRLRLQPCNWVQAAEGNIDITHAAWLHSGHITDYDRDLTPGSEQYYRAKFRREIRIDAYELEVGATYSATWPAEEGTELWQFGHFLLPFFVMNAPGVLPQKNLSIAWVPLDDENSMMWNIDASRPMDPGDTGIGGIKNGAGLSLGPPTAADSLADRRERWLSGPRTLAVTGKFLPNTEDWLGRFVPMANPDNNYLMDRAEQRNADSYTGIPEVLAQDAMAQASAGRLSPKTNEHLGTTDRMIIRFRRKLIAAAKAFRDKGTIPPGVDRPELYRMRSGGGFLPAGVDGFEAMHDVFYFRSDEPKLPVEAIPTP